MLVAALIVAGVAAALHVYIWAMEALWWTTPRVRATFGLTEQQAQDSRLMAFNQGFYNLFLAIVTAAGIVAYGLGADAVGMALVAAGTGSMVAAAVVLFFSDRTKAAAAYKQAAFPWLALVLLGLSAL